MSYVPFSHLSTEPCVVSWSEDQRIAVTTNELVYVLTLRIPLSVSNAGSNPYLPPAADNEKRLPLFVMSTVLAPMKSQLPKLELGGAEFVPLKTFPPAGNWPIMEMIDPILQDDSSSPLCDKFKSCDWTPAGCSGLGGCLLSCLTQGGRLLLYSPPAATGNRWTQVMDLTAEHSSHLLSYNFKDTTETSLNSVEMKNVVLDNEESEKREPEIGRSESEIRGSETMDTDEQDSKHNTSTSSSSDYVKRKLSLSVTAFSWLPALLKAELNEKMANLAVVAMATRVGHVILMGVEVPLTPDCKSNVITLQIIDGFVEIKGQPRSWVCSLKWTRRDKAAWLAFGCTNGKVGVLHWSDLSLSLVKPCFSLLWEDADCVPVHCLAWDNPHHFSGHPRWLAASKCSLVVVFDLSGVAKYTLVSGIHSVPVSGICSVSSFTRKFISTSLDGTVQIFEIPQPARSHVSHVTPKLITIETVQEGGSRSVHGITTSKNSLFAAVVLTQKQTQGRLKSRHKFQLHFLPLVGENKDYDLSSALWSWDLVEYLRQLPREQLVRTASSLTDPRMALQQAVLEEKEEAEIVRHKEEVLCQHLNKSLEAWMEWTEAEWNVGGASDKHSSLSLSLMYHWLTVWTESGGGTGWAARLKLLKKVAEKLDQCGGGGEECAACGVVVPVTSSQQETCLNGHTWSRCGITLTLVMDPRCSSCMQCRTVFNNSLTLCVQQGSWLEKLLKFEENATCVYCGGHFEQVM